MRESSVFNVPGRNRGLYVLDAYLARGLAARGHHVYVGCPREALLTELLAGSGATTLPMTFRSKVDLANMRQLRDVVRRFQIDIVNAQSSRDRYTSIFARQLYSLDCLVVHTRRQKPESMGGVLQKWLYTRGTAKIVAVSEGVKALLAAGGLPASHIEVIHNGTPAQKYAAPDYRQTETLRAKYGLGPQDRVIGCVSRKKQQEQILNALRDVKTPVTLLLVGVSSEPAWERIAAGYGVAHRVICTGRLPAAETLAHYGLFDLKVLASNMEGLSQSLLEAMGFGVPVVATRAAGNMDLIQDGVNGLFFEDGDTKQLAERIERLLADAGLRARLAANGKTNHGTRRVFDREDSGAL